jgi:hypothetical protein
MPSSVIDIIAYFVILVAFVAIVYYIWDSWFGASSQLKCIVSGVNGSTYCIRERSKEKEKEAIDLMANVCDKCEKFVIHLTQKIGKNDDSPYCEFVKRIGERFDKRRISESMPTSTLTSYNENKTNISLCLNREKNDDNQLIDEQTLTFVLLHEISHYGDTIGHQTDFWENFKFLLKEAEQFGIYQSVDYAAAPKPYCGITINSNPLIQNVKSLADH